MSGMQRRFAGLGTPQAVLEPSVRMMVGGKPRLSSKSIAATHRQL
jgi:hypothetical protein